MKARINREQMRLHGARLFIALIIFSFAGWIWETIHVSMLAGELVDRGFLFGPICPIYGHCLFVTRNAKETTGIIKVNSGQMVSVPIILHCSNFASNAG